MPFAAAIVASVANAVRFYCCCSLLLLLLLLLLFHLCYYCIRKIALTHYAICFLIRKKKSWMRNSFLKWPWNLDYEILSTCAKSIIYNGFRCFGAAMLFFLLSSLRSVSLSHFYVQFRTAQYYRFLRPLFVSVLFESCVCVPNYEINVPRYVYAIYFFLALALCFLFPFSVQLTWACFALTPFDGYYTYTKKPTKKQQLRKVFQKR